MPFWSPAYASGPIELKRAEILLVLEIVIGKFGFSIEIAEILVHRFPPFRSSLSTLLDTFVTQCLTISSDLWKLTTVRNVSIKN